MEIATNKIHSASLFDRFEKQAKEINLIHFASEAAKEMEFENISEFHQAVKRSMELCLQAGISLDGNFRQIYKCSYEGIEYDWKLSVLAYKLVCLNGASSNAKVARMQIELLKVQHLNYQ